MILPRIPVPNVLPFPMKTIHLLALAAVLLVFRLHAEEPAAKLIDVRVVGSGGRAVVFIPGLATPGSIWDESVAALGPDCTCYVVTLAGFGGMPPTPPHAQYLTDVRDALIADLRARKLDHPLIVGHSLGGDLALDLAAQAPDLPGRLVVVDSLPFLAGMMAPKVRTEADAQELAGLIRDHFGTTTQAELAAQQRQFVGQMVTSPEKAAAVSGQTGKSDPATVSQAMSELVGHDLRPALSSIKCPVLVLGALADKGTSGTTRDSTMQSYRTQYANLPQARFQFFPDARHFIMVDDPAGFQAVLRTELGEANKDPVKEK